MWYLQAISFLFALLFFFLNMRSQDTVVYSHNPHTGELEAGVAQGWGQLGLYKESLSPQKANLTLMHVSLSLRFKQWKGEQLFCGTIYLDLWLNAGPPNIYFVVLVCLTFALSKRNQWGPPEVDWPSVLCQTDEAWGFSSSSGVVTGLKDLVKITVLLFCVDVFQGQSRLWRGRPTQTCTHVFFPYLSSVSQSRFLWQNEIKRKDQAHLFPTYFMWHKCLHKEVNEQVNLCRLALALRRVCCSAIRLADERTGTGHSQACCFGLNVKCSQKWVGSTIWSPAGGSVWGWLWKLQELKPHWRKWVMGH